MTETAVMKKTAQDGTLTIYQAYTGQTEATIYLESKDLDLGTSDQEKYIDCVILDITYPEGDDMPTELYFAWCTKDRMQEAEVWSPDVRIFDQDVPIFDIRETSRYFRIKITDYFPTTIWQLARVIFLGTPAGGRV